MTHESSSNARAGGAAGADQEAAAPRPGASVVLTLAVLALVLFFGWLLLRSTSSGPPVAASDAGAASSGQPTWPPRQEGLQEAVEAAGFPPVGDESYHVHALLSVFVDGEPVGVPANIGIDATAGYLSPLHTHTPDGVIHFEADSPSTFTLGQFFTIWGVEFSEQRLGPFTSQGASGVHVYVNGSPVKAPTTYEIREGDNVVVAFGEPGSFPTEPPTDALEGAWARPSQVRKLAQALRDSSR